MLRLRASHSAILLHDASTNPSKCYNLNHGYSSRYHCRDLFISDQRSIRFSVGVPRVAVSQETDFYRIKRQRERGGLFTILIALIMFGFAVLLFMYGERSLINIFPSPLITFTYDHIISNHYAVPDHHAYADDYRYASVTDTPTITPTPFIPPAIETIFSSEVTPNANAVFSPLYFTLNCENFNEFTAATVFQNPINYMCAVFTYYQMTPNANGRRFWYRDGKLVHYESIPWDGEVGGMASLNGRLPLKIGCPAHTKCRFLSGWIGKWWESLSCRELSPGRSLPDLRLQLRSHRCRQ